MKAKENPVVLKKAGRENDQGFMHFYIIRQYNRSGGAKPFRHESKV